MATSNKPSKIIIFGATGLIGKFITSSILSAKQFSSVTIFTSAETVRTKSEQIATFKSQGAHVITGDVTSEADVASAYKQTQADTVVSCVGRAVIDSQILLLRLAEESGTVRDFFPSEYGTDIEYGLASAKEKPHQLKLKVRAFIRGAGNVSKLRITYVLTGPYSDLFLGKTSSDAYGTFDVRALRAVLLGDGKGPVSMTSMADTGSLVVAALLHPGAHSASGAGSEPAERILKVNSFTATPDEIVAEFEKQTGRKWKVDYVGLDELRASEAKAWQEGNPAATAYTLRRIWTEGGTLYEHRDNEEIGDPKMETLAEQVAKVIRTQTT